MEDKIIEEYCGIIKKKLADLDFEVAVNNAQKLIDNFPKSEFGYYYKAVALFAIGDIKNAITNYTDAIKINSSFGRAYFNLGICYLRKNMIDEALINIGRALIIFSKQNESDYKKRCIDALITIDNESKK